VNCLWCDLTAHSNILVFKIISITFFVTCMFSDFHNACSYELWWIECSNVRLQIDPVESKWVLYDDITSIRSIIWYKNSRRKKTWRYEVMWRDWKLISRPPQCWYVGTLIQPLFEILGFMLWTCLIAVVDEAWVFLLPWRKLTYVSVFKLYSTKIWFCEFQILYTSILEWHCPHHHSFDLMFRTQVMDCNWSLKHWYIWTM